MDANSRWHPSMLLPSPEVVRPLVVRPLVISLLVISPCASRPVPWPRRPRMVASSCSLAFRARSHPDLQILESPWPPANHPQLCRQATVDVPHGLDCVRRATGRRVKPILPCRFFSPEQRRGLSSSSLHSMMTTSASCSRAPVSRRCARRCGFRKLWRRAFRNPQAGTSFVAGPGKLRQGQHGHMKLACNGLESSADPANLLDPILAPRICHQLQIIDRY